MGRGGYVLILTQPGDEATTEPVVRVLSEWGVGTTYWDMATFPLDCVLTAELGNDGLDAAVIDADRKIALHDVRTIWYRRPRGFRFDSRM